MELTILLPQANSLDPDDLERSEAGGEAIQSIRLLPAIRRKSREFWAAFRNWRPSTPIDLPTVGGQHSYENYLRQHRLACQYGAEVRCIEETVDRVRRELSATAAACAEAVETLKGERRPKHSQSSHAWANFARRFEANAALGQAGLVHGKAIEDARIGLIAAFENVEAEILRTLAEDRNSWSPINDMREIVDATLNATCAWCDCYSNSRFENLSGATKSAAVDDFISARWKAVTAIKRRQAERKSA